MIQKLLLRLLTLLALLALLIVGFNLWGLATQGKLEPDANAAIGTLVDNADTVAYAKAYRARTLK